MTEYVLLVVVGVLLGLFIWAYHSSQKEREVLLSQIMDMCDRVMAGDYEEYIINKPSKPREKTRNFYKKRFSPENSDEEIGL